MKKTIILTLIITFISSCSSSAPKKTRTTELTTVDSGSVNYVIKSNIQHFVSCYKREPQTERHFITMNFIIDGKGNVENSQVTSNTKNTRLESCVKTILEGITFDNPKRQKAKATQSLTFVPAFTPQG